MAAGRFVKTFDGQQIKLTYVAVTNYIVPRWYVTVPWNGREHNTGDFVIYRDDLLEKGVYRIYHEKGKGGKVFLGYAPSLAWAFRMCATETKRLFNVEGNDKTAERIARQNAFERAE